MRTTKSTKGYPARPDGPMKHRANLRLPDALQERADRIGEVDRRKATDVLRWALEIGLEELEQRLGITKKR